MTVWRHVGKVISARAASVCLAGAMLFWSAWAGAQVAYRSSSSASNNAHANISYVGSGTTRAVGSGSTTCDYPSSWAAGDLLLCVIEVRTNASVTMPAGWTQRLAGSSGTAHQALVFWRIAAVGDDTTPTVTHLGTNVLMTRMSAFRNVDTTSPFEGTSSINTSGSDSTTEGNAITTTSAGAFRVFTVHVANNNDQVNSLSGWTRAFASETSLGRDAGIELWYRPIPTPGAQAAIVANRSDSNISSGGMLALRPLASKAGLTIAMPAGTAANDTQIATIAVRPADMVVSAPGGWTLLRRTDQPSGGTDGGALLTYYRGYVNADTSAQTWYGYDPNNTGQQLVGGIIDFSGTTSTDPVVNEGGNTTPNGTSHTANAIISPVPNTIVVSSHMTLSQGGGSIWTPPSGMTEAIDRVAGPSGGTDVGIALEMAYVPQAASGTTGNKTATTSLANSAADTGAAHLVILAATNLMADFRMDETTWNGTANEVRDSSGNGYHGRAAYAAGSGPTAITETGFPARTSGGQSTCNYGAFDTTTATTATQRTYTYAELSGFPVLPRRFSFLGWVKSNDVASPNQRIVANDDAQNGWALSIGDGGSGSLRFFNRNLSNNGAVSGDGTAPSCGAFCIDTTPGVITNNTWYYVAAVVDDTIQTATVYVFNASGTRLVRAIGAYNGVWANGSGAVSLGGETSASAEGTQAAYHFKGYLDEIQIFAGALTEAQVTQQRLRVRTCPSLNHVEFVHDGDALTCTPEPVVVLGCTTAGSCTGLPANQVTSSFTISPTTAAGQQWCVDSVCNTTLTVPATVTNGTTIYLRNASAATTRMAGTSSLASNTTIQCNNTSVSPVALNSTTACDISFAASGLLVSIPNHASCNAQTVTFQAVKANATATACTPAFANVNRDMTLSQSYINPTTGTKAASFDYVTSAGGATSSVAALSTSVASPTTLSNLYWDSTGTARLNNFRYADVGRVQLNPLVTGAGSTSGLNLAAVSGDQFVAAPASFSFSNITAAPLTAGADFSATVTAMNNCSTPAATPNFGKETAPESVTITLGSREAPTGANNCTTGPCSGTVSGSVGSWSAGAATASNLKYSEVGQIKLQADVASGNYLSSGLTATGTSATVGAFVPAYFDTEVTPACTAFTYSGQPFIAKATAKNALAATTVNYSNLSSCTVCSKAVTLSNLGVTTGFNGTNTLPAANFSAGIGTLSTITYTYPARLTAPATITVRAVDSTLATVSSQNHTEGSTVVRSGRVRLLNANGSELLDLPVPMTVEYWNGNTGWQRSTTDACTGKDAANAVSLALTSALSNSGASCVRDDGTLGESGAGCLTATAVAARKYRDATAGASTFLGDFNLWLSAPGAGKTGTVTLQSTVPSWLQYPWLSTTPSSPRAKATFGVFRGGPVLFMREAY